MSWIDILKKMGLLAEVEVRWKVKMISKNLMLFCHSNKMDCLL